MKEEYITITKEEANDLREIRKNLGLIASNIDGRIGAYKGELARLERRGGKVKLQVYEKLQKLYNLYASNY